MQSPLASSPCCKHVSMSLGLFQVAHNQVEIEWLSRHNKRCIRSSIMPFGNLKKDLPGSPIMKKEISCSWSALQHFTAAFSVWNTRVADIVFHVCGVKCRNVCCRYNIISLAVKCSFRRYQFWVTVRNEPGIGWHWMIVYSWYEKRVMDAVNFNTVNTFLCLMAFLYNMRTFLWVCIDQERYPICGT